MNIDRIPPRNEAVALFDDAINALIVAATDDESLGRLWHFKASTKRRLIGQPPSAVDAIARAAYADLQRMVSRAA